MRWQGRKTSTNVEDRRGRSPMVTRGLPIGCGGILLILIFTLLFGGDPQQLMDMLGQSQSQLPPQTQGRTAPGPGGLGTGPTDQLGQFASVVLADTETTWNSIFRQMGGNYREPTLVLFDRAVRSACGMNSSAVGPFYCPADQQVYLDLSFFDQLERFGAPGDFAQAYVIAHEVGHHVQNLLGISQQVDQARRRSGRVQGNQLSVRQELQADCLAGVWAHHAHRDRQLLEPGDVEEGLNAAAQIGDDMMQRRATGYTQPESWTHGSGEQRTAWLRRGMQSGDPNVCDTFQ